MNDALPGAEGKGLARHGFSEKEISALREDGTLVDKRRR